MRRKEFDRDFLGLTQQEIAALLKVTRSQWAMFKAGSRNLPPTAGARHAEMLVYMLSPEGKALKNVPNTDNEIKELLQKRLKENEYQQLVITRKIAKAQRKVEQCTKASQLLHFLNSPSQIKKVIMPELLPSTTAVVNMKYKKYTRELHLLQLDLELLQGQQQVFERHYFK